MSIATRYLTISSLALVALAVGPAWAQDRPRAPAPTPSPAGGPVKPGELEDLNRQRDAALESVGTSLDRVRNGHVKLQDLIRKYEVGDADTEHLVQERFREQIADLVKAADGILARGPSFEKDLELYEKALERAEQTFGRLSEVYQRKAVEKKSSSLMNTYRLMSDASAAKGRMMAENRKGIDKTRANVQSLIAKVSESRELLTDLKEFFTVEVEPEIYRQRMQGFLKELEVYNKELDQTVKNINQWLERRQDTSGDAPSAPSRSPGRGPSA
jgi:hypothetical protein